ncbi:MAG: hypothetical protein FWB79_01335 [Treponema sp.]|nr:hypothetical protein [Treponema sp.]
MKKIFVAVVCFAVVFAACDLEDLREWIEGTNTTLTIGNESSHTIRNVRWNGIDFSTGDNEREPWHRPPWWEIGSSDFTPGARGQAEVPAGNGFVHFRASSGTFRTQQMVSVEEGDAGEFIILNSTVVVDENDVTGPLGQMLSEP